MDHSAPILVQITKNSRSTYRCTPSGVARGVTIPGGFRGCRQEQAWEDLLADASLADRVATIQYAAGPHLRATSRTFAKPSPVLHSVVVTHARRAFAPAWQQAGSPGSGFSLPPTSKHAARIRV